MSIITAMFLFFLPLLASAQPPPDTLWTNVYVDGISSSGKSVLQTPEGDFVVAGANRFVGSAFSDLYIVKVDAYGDTIWTSSCGGNGDDGARDIKATNDGGYIIVGVTYPPGQSNFDIYLVKTDWQGDTLWTRMYGEYGITEFGNSVVQTHDGGYIIAGHKNIDQYTKHILIIKTDENGDSLWTREYDDGNGHAYSIIQLPDSGFVFTGIFDEDMSGYSDIVLQKLDSEGNTLWRKIFGGSLSDMAMCVQQTMDGGFVITGGSWSFSTFGYYDYFLLKTDSAGDSVWLKTYGGDDTDIAEHVACTSDGGYILCGTAESFGGNSTRDMYLVRTDSFGDTIWTDYYGDMVVTQMDWGYCVQQTSDGGFIATGITNTYNPETSARMWLLRFRWDGVLVEDWEDIQPYDFQLFPAHPNPFNGQTAIPFSLDRAGRVKIDIFDISGRSVGAFLQTPLHGWFSAGYHEVVWNAEGMSSGVYLVWLRVDGGSLPAAESRRHTMPVILLK